MTFIDFCTGIGGFTLALQSLGMKCVAQVEKDKRCLSVLKRHFPDIPKYNDLLTFSKDAGNIYADVFTFGDPCPKHSRARSNGDSNHPDLSGYCLALVGRYKPWGVVRENVPAPTVAYFAAGLETLGYGTVVIRMDSATHTGQSRQRDFVVGLHQTSQQRVRELFPYFEDGAGTYTTILGTRQIIPALTTKRTRYDSRDCYVWDATAGKLRILDSDEREAFAGFPEGWLAGFPEATCASMYGNCLTPIHAHDIGRCLQSAWQASTPQQARV